MGIYTSSTGEQKNTEDMPNSYLYNALRKSEANEDEINASALRKELRSRGEEINGTEDEEITNETDAPYSDEEVL